MNIIVLTGRITKDPEIKTGKDGSAYLYFCLAVDGGKDKDGNKIVDFIDCISYKFQAEFISKYVVKGTLLEVSGKLHTSNREDSEGNKTKRVTVKVDNVGILVKPPQDVTKACFDKLSGGANVDPNTGEPTAFDPDYSGELPFQI